MDTDLRSRLEKMLALTTSPNENEAKQAMEMLQKLLTKHNLDIAELELRGHKKAPGVQETGYDLGKTNFKWYLDLAETIASHYYCYPIIDRKHKTIKFVGRPDNVESLTSLYKWIIEQIRSISREARRTYIVEIGEHIDPLRWQLNFGEGIVSRLGDRLQEIKNRLVEDNKAHALVLHHESEISDWLDDKYGYRIDGQPTKYEREYAERQRIRKEFKVQCEANGDMEPYYKAYPYERPATPAQLAQYAADKAERDAKWEKEMEKMRRRPAPKARPQKEMSDADWRKYEQGQTANYHGRRSAAQVNLTPFIEAGSVNTKGPELNE